MMRRKLGVNGPEVGSVGLGCMSFSGIYGATSIEESHRCLDAAHDLGVNHLDTAELYGRGLSEEVIGAWLKTRDARPTIATKAGIRTDPKRHFDNSPEYLRGALEGSLRRLGVDRIDLYYIHRHDDRIPIEDVAGTMSRFVEEGKIASVGYSEIAPATVRRAHAVHPVAAVQTEYSLWSRMPEMGLLQTTRDIGAAFVAFSPLGRGIFADRFPESFGEGDFRRVTPRYQPENYAANRAMIARFGEFARLRGWTTSSAALAWVLQQGDHIIAIPGTRSADHLAELCTASTITFNEQDRAETARLLPIGFAHGARYSLAQQEGTAVYC